jgi:hypothetical protein
MADFADDDDVERQPKGFGYGTSDNDATASDAEHDRSRAGMKHASKRGSRRAAIQERKAWLR